MKCCLCENEIEKQKGWDLGNNALPLMDGRCCNKCNDTKVIPARILKQKHIIEMMKKGVYKVIGDDKNG